TLFFTSRLLSFPSPVAPPHLHSFPTRRSSDLGHGTGPVRARQVGLHVLDAIAEPSQLSARGGEHRQRSVQHDRVGSGKVLEQNRSEEHTSELQSRRDLVCRLLLEKKKKNNTLY